VGFPLFEQYLGNGNHLFICVLTVTLQTCVFLAVSPDRPGIGML